MFSMDCSRCPARPSGCEDCVVSVILSEEVQVDALSEESCGYVLEPEVRSAIEVLMALGLVSTLEIVGAETAA
ncbi:hypothetical protein G6019_13455 [Dietzia sp. DQ12-76]|nr:hypothetical protein CT688_06320 [Dietzia sp. JS16-p6b]MBB1025410.1 hypothetical protein [Dietzia sp. DQ12-76]MBB1027844.1 hypothetical protein [Dietzia sp. DQ11-38-2]QGW24349.1 hypothetical protein GJR88_02027 [Dietzia sp. DQ12-45-1b]